MRRASRIIRTWVRAHLSSVRRIPSPLMRSIAFIVARLPSRASLRNAAGFCGIRLYTTKVRDFSKVSEAFWTILGVGAAVFCGWIITSGLLSLFGFVNVPWMTKTAIEVLVVSVISLLFYVGIRLHDKSRHLVNALFGLLSLLILALVIHGLGIVFGGKPTPYDQALLLAGWMIALRVLLEWKFGRKGVDRTEVPQAGQAQP